MNGSFWILFLDIEEFGRLSQSASSSSSDIYKRVFMWHLETQLFCLFLYLTGVHFPGELQHSGDVSEWKIKCWPIRTREIGGVSLSDVLYDKHTFVNLDFTLKYFTIWWWLIKYLLPSPSSAMKSLQAHNPIKTSNKKAKTACSLCQYFVAPFCFCFRYCFKR